MGVNNNEEYFAQKGAGKVHMEPLPRGSRPYPWVLRGWSRWWFHCLARFTRFGYSLSVSIQSTPPEVASSNCLHSGNSWVAIM
jgi:hypothetical protein